MDNPEQITYFADTDARNRRVRFGIRAKDRTRHVYVIGKTGMGKSTLLENMAVQDIRNGNGFAFIDPHGKTAELLLEYIPKERIKDVIYFAPFDMENPISFNIMEDVGYDKRHLVVSGLMSTFKKIWVDAWSARMEYILGNTLLALLEYPDSTLLDVNRMLSDKLFRQKVVENITDPSVKSFWVDEFAKYTDRFASEATPAIQNKIGQFTSNPLIRNIIGQPESSFDLRKAMDEKKILIINLSKGRVGEQNANLLGSMLITKIYLSAMSRADIHDSELQKLPNFYLFVDEFQSFANESFANILSEARKYKLNLTIAHQYIEQMSEEVRAAVFGNVGTMITFRVGSYDSEVLEREFAPTFTAEDIVNLGAFQLYLRLMINGIGSQPFSARSMPPLEKPEQNYFDDAIESSRKKYTKPRAEIEEFIRNRGSDNNSSSSDTKNNKGDKNNHKTKVFRSDHSDKDKKKGRPLIDEKTKQELQSALQKEKQKVADFDNDKDKDIDSGSAPDSPDQDLSEISLNDIKSKTKPNHKSKKDFSENLKNSENKNSLKEALAAALGGIDLGKKNNNSNDNNAPISNKEASKMSPLNVPAPNKQDQNTPHKNSVNSNTLPQRNIKSQTSLPKKEEVQKKPENATTKEIPESDLKRILGV